ncbi:MAG: Crp/Fnr family transcriptional regulator [Thiolinea sp.]
MLLSEIGNASEALKRLPLFCQARTADLEILARSAHKVYAKRKQMLFQQGDPCEGFNVIVYGRVKMSLPTWAGGDKPVQIIEAGGCFGDITMFNGDAYFMNVQALEDSFFYYVPREAIITLIRNDPMFAMQMLGSLSAKVKGLVDDIESFTLQPPAARLITYLLRLLPQDCAKTAKIELSINKNVVAAQLNLTPETLSRYFKELTNKGLVTVEGRWVLVHDVDQLGIYLSQCGKAPHAQLLQVQDKQLQMN